MRVHSAIIKINFWLNVIVVCVGCTALWAAEDPFEYRLERMVPRRQRIPALDSSTTIAADGSFWSGAGDRVYHTNSDGSQIEQFYIESLNNSSGYITDIVAGSDGAVWVMTNDKRVYQLNFNAMRFVTDIWPTFNVSSISAGINNSLWLAGRGLINHITNDGDLIEGFKCSSTSCGDHIISENDGSVWVVDNTTKSIEHYTHSGNLINRLKYSNIESYSPVEGITIAADNSLWVAFNRHIVQFTSNRKVNRQFNYPENVVKLSGFVITADNTVWIGDSSKACSLHFDLEGRSITPFGNCNRDSQFYGPGTIAVAGDNSVWTADENRGRIQHFSSDGAFLAAFADYPSFSAIQKLVVAPDNTLWAFWKHYPGLHSISRGLQHLSTDGSGIKTNIEYINISDLYDLDFTPFGTFWTFNSSFARHYKTDGVLLTEISKPFSEFNLFSLDYSINLSNLVLAVAADYTVWLAHKYNLRHFNHDGTFLSESTFTQPITDIKTAADGSFWLVADGIQHFSSNGSYLNRLGSCCREPGQYSNVHEIAIAKDNALWIAGNDRIQKFVPRLKGQTAHPYKAIILAGGAKQTGEAWNGAWQLAQKAKLSLLLQGFKMHDEVALLTAGNTQMDLDQNGQFDDLQVATKENLRLAITNWAKDTTDLVLYLASTSIPGQLQINATETLSANELATWLAELEKVIPGKVTVIFEADQSGSFLQALANPTRPRVVIASSQGNQPALMADHGVNSFSYSFWNQVMDGAPLVTALQAGQQTLSPFVFNNQPLQAQLDATGDGQSDAQDLTALGDYCLGMCTKTVSTPPVISPPTPKSITLTNTTSAEFSITLTSTENILETWAIVQRPDPLSPETSNQLNLEKIPLACDAQGLCRGRYHRFNAQGTYRIHFYALDAYYQLNTPVSIDVSQANAQAIIPAEYIAPDHTLYLYDVQVDQRHYQASLKQHNGLFQLQSLSLAPETLTPAAQFDTSTGLLNIQAARVNGQICQGSFKWVDNYLFQLLEATPTR